jgi:hypothetical protein
MADSSPTSKLCITRLIVVPAVITLAVTLLRLLGELQHWSSLFFNRAAGGGGAIMGISWLPIIFGPYFAVKIARAGEEPMRFGKAFGFAALGVIIFLGGGFLGFAGGASPGKMLAGLAVMVVAAALQFVPWRALAKTLIAYAYAARIPVAIVMFFAIRGNWGTHYDALPPEGAIPSGFWLKYLYIALIPQLVMWIAYTIILGALFGTAYVAIARRKKPAPESQQATGA